MPFISRSHKIQHKYNREQIRAASGADIHIDKASIELTRVSDNGGVIRARTQKIADIRLYARERANSGAAYRVCVIDIRYQAHKSYNARVI
jgi:hypothetical protein